MGKEFQPFVSRQKELSVLNGCLLWGSRLIIPPQGRKYLLDQLHETHLGSSRMKSLGHGYIWWPGMDSEIEEYVKACGRCQIFQPLPPVAPVHPWDWPRQPWVRLHLDFAGPFMGSMYLVLVDAYSKWLEVVIMNSITSISTIDKLQQIFAEHGLPKMIVTDNGPSFTSTEFKKFLDSNGIRHITYSPYQPSTNGLAERAVQSFKGALRKIQGGSLQARLTRFLFRYRLTPHTTTGYSPAEMLMGRRPRSHLDLLHPDIGKKIEERQQKQIYNRVTRVFKVGDKVFARDFRSNKLKWLHGEIVKVSGPVSYQVKIAQGVVRRHVNSLRKCDSGQTDQTDAGSNYRDDFDLLQPTIEPSNTESSSPSSITGSSDSGPRRSTRDHHPPNRFQGLVYY